MAILKESETGPDGQDYKVWTNEGTDYLVDGAGKPVYQREVGSVLDLRRRFFPWMPEDLIWPSLAAFSVLILSLLWVGIRGPSSTEQAAEVPGAHLSKEGEISSGQDDLT